MKVTGEATSADEEAAAISAGELKDSALSVVSGIH